MSENAMEIKTQAENQTSSSMCALKNLEIWPRIEMSPTPMLLAAFGGMPTGCDLVIPENLPLEVLKSYLIQRVS